MDTILNRVNREYNKLAASGKKPNSLFLSAAGRDRLAKQAASAYGIQEDEVRQEFLGMKVYVAGQYIGDNFRIYCEVVFEEF